MEEQQNTKAEQGMSNTDLAFERTILAENRTLMAWIRTAISMISFGFTIYKFFHEIKGAPGAARPIFTAREVGMLMIAFGLLSLFWGILEYNAVIKKLNKSYPGIQRSKATWLAVMVLIFGLVLFFAALLRQ